MYCSASSAYICPTWLLLTFIPVLCHLVPSLMEHNVMVSGRQIDPEQTCMTGSPLQYACGFLSHRTLQFVGSSASLLTPQLLSAEHELEGVWEQPVLFFFSSSIITVLTVRRESKGVIQMSGETLSYTTAIYL